MSEHKETYAEYVNREPVEPPKLECEHERERCAKFLPSGITVKDRYYLIPNKFCPECGVKL